MLYAWYGGLEGGNALARVLFGDVDACGKLPCTFPKQLADSPAHALNAADTPPHAPNAFYPGVNGAVTYAEGLLVGYRWFDAKQIEPLFPFGYGLSYTTFKYSNLKLTQGGDSGNPTVTVEFDLANTGARAGAEVAQVYAQEENPKRVPASQGVERLRQGGAATGGNAENFRPPGPGRVRVLRPRQERMGGGERGLQNSCWQFVEGHPAPQDECQLRETVFTPDTPAGGGGTR